MFGAFHIFLILGTAFGTAFGHSEFDSPVIDEYDRHGFTTSNYQALYNKSRNEYIVKKQRMFDVAQDFKEAKAAYTAAVNAQLGQAVDSDGNIITGGCSWFSYSTADGGCAGGVSGTTAAAAVAGGSVAGFAILDKLLPLLSGCCGVAVGAAATGGQNQGGGGGGGGGGGFRGGGRGYRNYNQTMDVHCVEGPILPTQKPKKKKKNKQIWLVCMVIMVLLVIIGVGFALSQDSL